MLLRIYNESEEIILYVQVLLSRINNSILVFLVNWRIPRILLNAPRLDSIAQNSRGNETHINLKKAQDFSLKCTFTSESRFYTITYSLKLENQMCYIQQFITPVYNKVVLFIFCLHDIVYTLYMYTVSI